MCPDDPSVVFCLSFKLILTFFLLRRAYNACNFQANIALQNEITNTLMPRLEALTPSSRVYLNEGDFRDSNWKTNFYGANYASLLSIKDKYDPNSLFYGLTAVGSDRWTVQPDGRLCRTS